MNYYVKRTDPAANGWPKETSVYCFPSRISRDSFISNGHAEPRITFETVTAKEAREFAQRDDWGDRYVIDWLLGGVAYPFGTPNYDADVLSYYRKHPASVPTERDIDTLARLDIELLRTIRANISCSASWYAPTARARIDAVLGEV